MAWSLGNLHFGVQVLQDAVRVIEDPARAAAPRSAKISPSSASPASSCRSGRRSPSPSSMTHDDAGVSLAGAAACRSATRPFPPAAMPIPMASSRSSSSASSAMPRSMAAPSRESSLAHAGSLRIARRPLRAGGRAGRRSRRRCSSWMPMRRCVQDRARTARSQPRHGPPPTARLSRHRRLAHACWNFARAVEEGRAPGSSCRGLRHWAWPRCRMQALLTSWAFQSLSAVCLSAPKLLRIGQDAAQRVLTAALAAWKPTWRARSIIARDDLGWFDPVDGNRLHASRNRP